ncbi:GDSL-type esterase/lipase family protein [Caproicibacterium sp. NSD3]
MKRYDRTVRWTGILEEKLYPLGYRIIEEGLCGRTTVFEDELRAGRKGSEQLPILLESHMPLDRIVLMLGTNDCKTCYGASADVIGLGIEKLLEEIRQVSPKIRVLLISPIFLGEEVWKSQFDPEFDRKSVQMVKKLKRVYQKIADRYHCDFLAASDLAEVSKTDMEHLDAKDHRKLAEAVFEIIKKE